MFLFHPDDFTTVDALQSVDTTIPEASLNATSISDNNGDRISIACNFHCVQIVELNEDGEVIKK